MRLRYRVEVDDLIAFTLLHQRRSPALRRQLAFFRWGVGLLLPVALFVFLHVLDRQGPLAVQLLLPLGAGAVYVSIYPGLTRSSIRRTLARMFREGAQAGVLGEHELVVEEAALVDVTEAGEGRYRWDHVQEVLEADGRCLIYTSAHQALVIPRAGVLEGDFDGFREAAEARLSAARG